MMPLLPLISEATYGNLLNVDQKHQEWSGFNSRFADPLIVFYAFGLITIPREFSYLEESRKDFNIRPVEGKGFKAYYPRIEGEHPFSCPRATTPEDQDPNYARQYKRVEEFRGQIRGAHAKTWGKLEQIA